MKPCVRAAGWRGALLAGLVGILISPVVSAAGDLTVNAKRVGHAVAVQARATVTAPADLIWSTLTDYDGLSDFIPGISVSRIISRRGPVAIVEQQGQAGFLFFSYAIDVVVASVEYPPNLIEIHIVSGNLRQLDGAYRLAAGKSAGTWVLSWSGLIEPAWRVPAFISVGLMRRNVESQFYGMIAEIERRQLATAVPGIDRAGPRVAAPAW